MPAEEVFEFCCEMDRKMDEAYQWELWGFAYLVNGGCGDDTFMDFRASLIALGQERFENAIKDAESLLVIGESQLQEMFEEGFVYSSTTAYKELTGDHPDTNVESKSSPSGNEWEESRESLQALFPKAWLQYGWEEPVKNEQHSLKKPWWKFW